MFSNRPFDFLYGDEWCWPAMPQSSLSSAQPPNFIYFSSVGLGSDDVGLPCSWQGWRPGLNLLGSMVSVSGPSRSRNCFWWQFRDSPRRGRGSAPLQCCKKKASLCRSAVSFVVIALHTVR